MIYFIMLKHLQHRNKHGPMPIETGQFLTTRLRATAYGRLGFFFINITNIYLANKMHHEINNFYINY